MCEDNSLDNEDNSLENLEALERRARYLRECLETLEERKEILENSYQSIEAREELSELVEAADNVSENPQFRDRFCRAYERNSGVVDLAELVASILFPANLPVVVASLIAVKLARIAIDNYCAD